MSSDNGTTPTYQPRQQGFMIYPSGRLRKAMFKAPLYLWRLGLGRLFARYFLVLTVTGRKSGLPRHTMLEYSNVEGKKYLASGWGKQAQWYKNALTDPYVTVQTVEDGAESGVACPVAEDAELARLFDHFRHSPVWEVYLQAWDIQPNVEDFIAKKDRLCLLRIDPTDTPTPPPLETDLVWVWPVLLVLAFAAGLLRWLTR